MADPLASAATSLIGRLTADLVKSASAAVAKEIEIFNTPSKIRSMSRKLASKEMVKTINNPDKPAKISSFFVMPSFQDTESKTFEATTVDDFGDGEHPLIEGIAGQGKSIFMRQLCIQELKLGRRLPILIELRKIKHDKNISHFAIEYLRAVGFCSCDEVLRYILETGFAVLLLDGYDEVQEDCRPDLIHEINMLSASFEQLRIVMTSRPDTSIKGVSCLRTITMQRLDKTQRNAIINKICDRSIAIKLIDKIAKNSNLREIVDTPLFATLLCIVYRAENRLPETVHEFYDMVFQTLLYRHDQQKEGYERPRKSGLGNHQFSVVFEHFCMRTALVQRLSLSQEEATEIIANALVKEGLEVSLADKYFSDITKITCLLVKDGIEYQFLHKSIQEYFSARYIRRLPEEKAQEFFRKILESPTRIKRFRRQLYFLYEIDSYRAFKYFALPSLDLAFSSDKEFGVDLRKAYCSESLKTLFDVPLLIQAISRENVSKTILQDAYKGAYRISVGSGIVIVWYTHKESTDPRRHLRLAVLDHFDLLEILCTAVYDVIYALTEDKNGPALGHFSDSTYEASASDSLFTKQHLLPKVIMSLGLQDRVAQIVKSSAKWKKFQGDVDDMIAMLERMDRADLLDII
jgi:hypothetical protein